MLEAPVSLCQKKKPEHEDRTSEKKNEKRKRNPEQIEPVKKRKKEKNRTANLGEERKKKKSKGGQKLRLSTVCGSPMCI